MSAADRGEPVEPVGEAPDVDRRRGRHVLEFKKDDDRLGGHVRRQLPVYEHGDRENVRVQALRLLIDLSQDYSAARDLLRRLTDVGE